MVEPLPICLNVWGQGLSVTSPSHCLRGLVRQSTQNRRDAEGAEVTQRRKPSLNSDLDTGSIILPFSQPSPLNNKPRALRASQKEEKMKRLLTLTALLLCVITAGVQAQNSMSSASNKAGTKQTKRGPVFRATKDQINQAQALLKTRGFYSGEQVGKLDDATREGLRKYQQAEGLKVTGTLNKITLEKMNITLTDKQKAM